MSPTYLYYTLLGHEYNIKYATTTSNQKYDLFIPKKTSSKLVICIHGGGFSLGDNTDERTSAQNFADLGYWAISVDYTKLDGNITSIYTIYQEVFIATIKAIQHIKKDYGVQIESCATYGVSAGGMIALLMPYSVKTAIPIKLAIAKVPTTTCNPDLIRDSYFYNLVVSSMRKLGHEGTDDELFLQGACGGDNWQRCSPADCKYTIPTVVAFGAKDDIVPKVHREVLLNKLNESGTNYREVLYPDSNHTLESDSDYETFFQETVKIMLKTYL